MTDTTISSTVAEKIAALPRTRISLAQIESMPTQFHDRVRAGETFPVEVRRTPHAIEDLLILPYVPENNSMWVNTWEGETVYSWWIRKTNHQLVEPADDVALAQARAEVDLLRDQVETLQAEAERLRTRHQEDIDAIGASLLREAESRDWCGEYDAIIRDLNTRLHKELKPRERDYEVEVAITYRISRTVSASSSDAAREEALEDREHFLDLVDPADDPFEYEVVDVDVA